MPTYGDLKSAVADTLNDNVLSTDSRVSAAITSALRKYQDRSFRFNDGTASITTVAGTASYTPSVTFGSIRSVTIDAGAYLYPLEARTLAELEAIDVSDPAVQSRPVIYAWYNEQIRFYPTPDAVYSISVKGTKRLTAFSADADTNGWSNDGFDLIVSAAVADLCVSVSEDPGRAAQFKSLESEALAALAASRDRVYSSGRLRGYF